MSDRKIYVLDTSVLLHNPQAMFSFQDNEIVLPIIVLDEVDKFKRGSQEVNRNARVVIKNIDKLREQGNIEEGVPLGKDGIFKIAIKSNNFDLLPAGFQANHDNLIIATALAIKKENPEKKVIMVSKDINMRVKAQALGLKSEDYRADKVNLDELYTGEDLCQITDEEMAIFYEKGYHEPNNVSYNTNQYITVGTPTNKKALGRYDRESNRINLLKDLKNDVFGIKSMNKEQRFALDMLLDDSVLLVTMLGKAGTGKTILALAAGLQKVLNDKVYRKMSVYRPLIPMGKDIGYLPGKEGEKLSPWMHPIFDNLEFLLTSYTTSKKTSIESKLDSLITSKLVEIASLTLIRGIKSAQQYLIIDEDRTLPPMKQKQLLQEPVKEPR
jgi:PhoH-like ATPase